MFFLSCARKILCCVTLWVIILSSANKICILNRSYLSCANNIQIIKQVEATSYASLPRSLHTANLKWRELTFSVKVELFFFWAWRFIFELVETGNIFFKCKVHLLGYSLNFQPCQIAFFSKFNYFNAIHTMKCSLLKHKNDWNCPQQELSALCFNRQQA